MADISGIRRVALISKDPALASRVRKEFDEPHRFIQLESLSHISSELPSFEPDIILIDEGSFHMPVEMIIDSIRENTKNNGFLTLLLVRSEVDEGEMVVALGIDGLIPAVFPEGLLRAKVDDFYIYRVFGSHSLYIYDWMKEFGKGEGDILLDMSELERSALLYAIFLFRRTGDMTFRDAGGSIAGEIGFTKGYISSISCRSAPQFHKYLIDSGDITKDMIEPLLESHEKRGIPLRLLLISEGLLSPMTCLLREKEYHYSLIDSLFTPEQGTVTFSAKGTRKVYPIPLSGYPFSILLRTIKETNPPVKIIGKIPMDTPLLLNRERFYLILNSLENAPQGVKIIGRLSDPTTVSVMINGLSEKEKLEFYYSIYFFLLTGVLEQKTGSVPDSKDEIIYEDAILEPLKEEGSGKETPPPLSLSYIHQKFLDVREMDPYKILEIDRGASQEEIDDAYIRLIKVFDGNPLPAEQRNIKDMVKVITQGIKTAYRNVSSELSGSIELTDPFASITEIEQTIAHVNAELTFEAGMEFLEKGEFIPAIRELRRAVESSPDNPLYNFNLGKALLLSPDSTEEDYRKAMRYLKVAIALSPENGRYYFFLGITCMKLGMFIQAIVNFKMALHYDPSIEEARDYIKEIENRDKFIG